MPRPTQLPTVAVINAGRLDWDRQINWATLPNSAVYHEEPEHPPSDDDIILMCRGCDVMVTKEIQITASLIESLPGTIKLICEAGTGYNNIDMDECRTRGITVMNVPSYSEDAVASLVLTFILNHAAGLVTQQRMISDGDRSSFEKMEAVTPFEVAGKTLGLVGGRGSIGTKVTALAKALGMRVIVSTRNPPAPPGSPAAEDDDESDAASDAGTADGLGSPRRPPLPPPMEDGVVYVGTLDELLEHSDFVSLHCPLNDDTSMLMGKDEFELMKTSAYFINTARGGLVDEEALVDALTSGQIAGAALDVQDPEPPEATSMLWSLDNVVLTPHMGWKRVETRQRLIIKVADNIAKYRAGMPENVVS